MSHLGQMHSSMPRPTRSGIPTSFSAKAGGAKPAASRAASGDTPDGRQTVEDPLSKRCDVNSTGDEAPSHKSAAGNAVSRPPTAKLNGHAKMANAVHISAPRGGGALTTMPTAQLRSLANTRPSNGSSAATGIVPKVRANVIASTVSKGTTPVNRKPLAPVAKKNIEFVTKPKTAEPARRPTALSTPSLGASSKSSGSVTRPITSFARKPTSLSSTTSAKLAGQKVLPTTKASPPTERPLGPDQERCDTCGRGFDRGRIEKHRGICKKAASKKVKVFDATKMRTKGTEVEAYVKRGLHKKEVPVKKSNWRAVHEEFIQTVRQAKVMQDHLAKGGKLSDLPPPPPSSNPDYVPCPYCGRKFNESAAERHIPRCKEVSARKRPPTAAHK